MPEHKSTKVRKDLERAYAHGSRFNLAHDLNSGKMIVFSDHHRGSGPYGGDDDSYRSSTTYLHALQHYFDSGYKLVLLGDVEELWERRSVQDIYEKYHEIYDLEARFYSEDEWSNRYYRLFGNHDFIWEETDYVRQRLWPLGNGGLEGMKVCESIRLDIIDDGQSIGEALLTHGHQGQYNSTLKTKLIEAIVAGWGPLQNWVNKPLNLSPHRNKHLGRKVNYGYYLWAKYAKKLLITGHTHHPVFESSYWPEREEQIHRGINKSPNLFNTGCCSFANGSITAIELDGPEIRLVEWQKRPSGQFVRSVGNSSAIKNVLAAI